MGLIYSYNRAAFGEAAKLLGAKRRDGAVLLVELYCRLVRIELALKEHHPTFVTKEHDVIAMLLELPQPAAVRSREKINSAKTKLENCLEILRHNDRKADPCEERQAAHKWPHLRYLRHNLNYSGGTTDQQLRNAIEAADDVETELKQWKISV